MIGGEEHQKLRGGAFKIERRALGIVHQGLRGEDVWD